MDVGAVLIQLKVAMMDGVVAWQNQLNRLKHEAIETL